MRRREELRDRKAIVLGRDSHILPLANVPMLSLFLIICVFMTSSEICLAETECGSSALVML